MTEAGDVRSPLRVLLLGFGGLSEQQDHQTQMYGPAFAAHDGFEIVATSDLSTGGSLPKVSAELGIEHRESWREALESSDIDLVSVCVPLDRRPEVATAALSAGKHVLIDKPMTDSPTAAAAVAELAAEVGLVCMPAHHQRFHPMLKSAGEAIAAGRVGLPWNVQADFIVAGGIAVEAGELLNFAVYPIDAVLALIEQPVHRVYARVGKYWHGGDDFTLLMLDHTHGVTSTIAVGRQRDLADRLQGELAIHRYRISGSQGVLDVDVLRPGVAVRTADSVRQRLAGSETVQLMLAELKAAIHGGRQSRPSAADGQQVAAVLAVARESAANNRPVEVAA